MWQLYVFSFLAGLFAANGVPHFVKGGFGQKHRTPFGKPSSALVNVCWGWSNLVIAVIFLHFAHVRAHEYRAFTIFAISVLIMTILNAIVWSRHLEYNIKSKK
jgi:hypothetical protein